MDDHLVRINNAKVKKVWNLRKRFLRTRGPVSRLGYITIHKYKVSALEKKLTTDEI